MNINLKIQQQQKAKVLIYALQWLGYTLACIMMVPIVTGLSLGLSGDDIAAFVQTTLLLVGVFSILQVTVGHRFVVIEGPGGMWYSLFIILALFYPQIGRSLTVLRSDIVTGMLVVGLIYLLMTVTGLARKIMFLFTPLVNGTFLILMPLLLSATVIKGILGGNEFNLRGFIAAMAALIVIVVISLRAKGFLQTISFLCGILVGWVLAYLLGVSQPVHVSTGIISLPKLFPWGTPTFDYGVLISCIITGILILSNHIASTVNMAKILDVELTDKRYNCSIAITGVANIAAAVWGAIGFIPFTSTIGFLQLTNNYARLPFIVSSFALILLGLFPVVGGVVAAIPHQLGYVVLFIVFCQLFGLGLREYQRISLSQRDIFISGFSILIGVGVMMVPFEIFDFMHHTLRIILANGLIVGLTTCIILDQVLKRNKDYSRVPGANESRPAEGESA